MLYKVPSHPHISIWSSGSGPSWVWECSRDTLSRHGNGFRDSQKQQEGGGDKGVSFMKLMPER